MCCKHSHQTDKEVVARPGDDAADVRHMVDVAHLAHWLSLVTPLLKLRTRVRAGADANVH